MTPQEFSTQVQNYKQVVQNLEDVNEATAIKETINRLTRMNYSPMLIFSTENFLSFSKADVLREIDRIAKLSDQEMIQQGFDRARDFFELKVEHIALLVYHFKLLLRLRRDNPEAWDEIDEMYGDD